VAAWAKSERMRCWNSALKGCLTKDKTWYQWTEYHRLQNPGKH
jgi:hypothetical protein